MGEVIFLRGADRKCRDCGCTKAMTGAAAKRDPLTIFTPTEACGRCGDEVEVEHAPGMPEEGLVCDDCGQPDAGGLVSGTVMLPYNLGRGMVLLCGGCLARRDEIATSLCLGKGDGAQA